jgi:hypothetical protein
MLRRLAGSAEAVLLASADVSARPAAELKVVLAASGGFPALRSMAVDVADEDAPLPEVEAPASRVGIADGRGASALRRVALVDVGEAVALAEDGTPAWRAARLTEALAASIGSPALAVAADEEVETSAWPAAVLARVLAAGGGSPTLAVARPDEEVERIEGEVPSWRAGIASPTLRRVAPVALAPGETSAGFAGGLAIGIVVSSGSAMLRRVAMSCAREAAASAG